MILIHAQVGLHSSIREHSWTLIQQSQIEAPVKGVKELLLFPRGLCQHSHWHRAASGVAQTRISAWSFSVSWELAGIFSGCGVCWALETALE